MVTLYLIFHKTSKSQFWKNVQKHIFCLSLSAGIPNLRRICELYRLSTSRIEDRRKGYYKLWKRTVKFFTFKKRLKFEDTGKWHKINEISEAPVIISRQSEQLLIPDIHLVQVSFGHFVAFERLLARCDR